MSKSINKIQSDILLNRIQNNRPIACGFVKVSKDEVGEFWSYLVVELNSAGPPIKTVLEWKKVWMDQKSYDWSKAAANLKNQRGTGGGPNQTKRAVSVEGLENYRFGLPKGSKISSCSKRLTPTPLDTPPAKQRVSLQNEKELTHRKSSTIAVMCESLHFKYKRNGSYDKNGKSCFRKEQRFKIRKYKLVETTQWSFGKTSRTTSFK